jgi:hypothetical protein
MSSSNDTPKPGGWFTIPNSLIDTGAIAGIKSLAGLDGYLCLRRWRKDNDEVWCTLDWMAEKTGHAKGAISRGLAEVVKLGWIEVIRDGKKGQAKLYRLKEIIGCARATNNRLRRRTNGLRPRAESVAPTRGIGCAHDTPLRLKRKTEEKDTTTTPENAGVGGVPVEVNSGTGKAYAALTAAGIREPTRTQLLDEIPGLEAEVIQQIAEEVTAGGGRGGVLVNTLKADGVARSQQWREDAPMRAAAAAEEAQEEALALARERLESMSRGDFAALVELVAAKNDGTEIGGKIRAAYREGMPRLALLGERVQNQTMALMAAMGGAA